MLTQTKLTRIPILLLVILIFLLSFTLAACNAAANNSGVEPAASNGTENTEDIEDMDHEHEDDADHEHEDDADHEHEHENMERIDNAGAVIRITSPADGSTFGSDEDVIVEIEVENFTLGEDGSHWHIYIDGASWGMVSGQATSQVLRGVDPGEHELAVYLAGGDHIELADGDAITITIEE